MSNMYKLLLYYSLHILYYLYTYTHNITLPIHTSAGNNILATLILDIKLVIKQLLIHDIIINRDILLKEL